MNFERCSPVSSGGRLANFSKQRLTGLAFKDAARAVKICGALANEKAF